MFIKKIELTNEKDTENLSKKIGAFLQKKDFVALRGDLGAGKTSFSRSLIRHLGDDKQEVPSPTFTLVQFYDLPKFTLWHFDLYRIKHPEEIYELGWEDACHDGVVLAEWPENLGNLIPEDRIEIELFFTGKDGERIATIKGLGEMEERLNGAGL
jgi:tRNA threonylcarbamoyladenosine biosynthesis protein TsaE